jgi:hypothetical protein
MERLVTYSHCVNCLLFIDYLESEGDSLYGNIPATAPTEVKKFLKKKRRNGNESTNNHHDNAPGREATNGIQRPSID